MKPKIRVLHIDDNLHDRQLVRDTLLKEHGNFEVEEADNREKFEYLIRDGDFDIILSDFNILGFDGLQVLQAVREIKPGIPVIIVTGTGSEEIAIRAMKMGAADYVIKSYNHIRGLAPAIRTVLDYQKVSRENKQALEDLQESEQKYRTLVTQSPDGIFILDLQGRFISVNQAMCRTLQYREEELLSMSIWDIVPGEFQLMHQERLSKIQTGEKLPEPAEYIVTARDGNKLNIEIHSAPFINKEKLIGVQGIGRDITERRRVEKELLAAKEKAEENNRLKSAFLANMSHEIRTPMNAILGFSDLMVEAEGAEKNSFAEIIRKSSRHLLKIIDDIVLFSRLQSEKIPLQMDGFRPADIVADVYQLFNLPEMKRGLELVMAVPDQGNDLIIRSDQDKIKQALINLVTNALKYTDRGRVEIGLEIRDGEVEWYVLDTGIGIPEKEQERIFDSFYRGKQVVSSAIGGTGLGLNIAKELVELLGGAISVSSKPGIGSRFSIVLPVQPAGEITRMSPAVQPTLSNWKDKIILVAEDDPDNFQYLMFLIKDKVGRIDRAENGREAVALALKTRYDLILMDLKMPEMGGIEATREIRSRYPVLPVIAQTAYAFPEDIQCALVAGCDDYLVKPINKTDLLKTLDKYL